jgi:hypothetical protein
MENLANNQSMLSHRHFLVINISGHCLSPCLAPSVEDVVTLLSIVALGCNKLLIGLLRWAGCRHLLVA